MADDRLKCPKCKIPVYEISGVTQTKNEPKLLKYKAEYKDNVTFDREKKKFVCHNCGAEITKQEMAAQKLDP